MSVVGIDFGNESCFVAVARSGGIETVDNDFSLRATPSFVAFGGRQRILGVAAKNQAVTNTTNTIFNFKRLLGRQFDDPGVQDDIRRAPYKVGRTSHGGIGIEASYLGENHVFTPEQIAAMLFTKLKETAEHATNTKVHDCVISVPSYFTNAERHALLDACRIAGLNVLRPINETTAAALSYGFYRQDLPPLEAPSRNVVIVDCGHSATQVAVCAFNNGKLKVLASTGDPYLGGRNFDVFLASHFIAEFRAKYAIDVEGNSRAYMRLLTEVEKLKKQMSANATKLPLNIECLIDDKDVSSSLCRADFEQICAPLFNRVEKAFQKCLEDSHVELQDIHSVEIIGGSTRIPVIKKLIEKVFRKTPSTTLNQDEAVSKGCALYCAILSPTLKVKDFKIRDILTYPIKLVWDESLGEDGAKEIFSRYHPVPFTRVISFVRKGPMTISAVYDQVPFPVKAIGKFMINFQSNHPEPLKLEVFCKINRHGLFVVSGAKVYEKVETNPANPVLPASGPIPLDAEGHAHQLQPPVENQQEDIPVESEASDQSLNGNLSKETSDPNPGNEDVDMESMDGSQPEKIRYKAREVPVIAESWELLSRTELDQRIASELHMMNLDRNEKERLDCKNSLEEYVYELRQNLDLELKPFVEEKEREILCNALQSLEIWLYEDGSEEKKEMYVSKLHELKSKGEPIKERLIEASERPRAFQDLESALQRARKFVELFMANDPRYDHIPPKELESVIRTIRDTEAWMEKARQKLHPNNFQIFMPVPVKCSEITEQRRILDSKISPIINMPKPQAKPEPPKEDLQPPVEPQPPSQPKSSPGSTCTEDCNEEELMSLDNSQPVDAK